MSTVYELIDAGKSLGLTGDPLNNWVTTQQKIEREERKAEREIKLKQMDQEEKVKQQEMEQLEKDRALKEKLEVEKLRLEQQRLEIEKAKIQQRQEENEGQVKTKLTIPQDKNNCEHCNGNNHSRSRYFSKFERPNDSKHTDEKKGHYHMSKDKLRMGDKCLNNGKTSKKIAAIKGPYNQACQHRCHCMNESYTFISAFIQQSDKETATTTQIDRENYALNFLKGKVNKINVHVFRDTGCTGVLVKSSFVKPYQYSGKYKTCVMVDGSKKRYPVVYVNIDCQNVSGKVEALAVKTLICDLVIGNAIRLVSKRRATKKNKNLNINTLTTHEQHNQIGKYQNSHNDNNIQNQAVTGRNMRWKTNQTKDTNIIINKNVDQYNGDRNITRHNKSNRNNTKHSRINTSGSAVKQEGGQHLTTKTDFGTNKRTHDRNDDKRYDNVYQAKMALKTRTIQQSKRPIENYKSFGSYDNGEKRTLNLERHKGCNLNLVTTSKVAECYNYQA